MSIYDHATLDVALSLEGCPVDSGSISLPPRQPQEIQQGEHNSGSSGGSRNEWSGQNRYESMSQESGHSNLYHGQSAYGQQQQGYGTNTERYDQEGQGYESQDARYNQENPGYGTQDDRHTQESQGYRPDNSYRPDAPERQYVDDTLARAASGHQTGHQEAFSESVLTGPCKN